MRVPVQNTLQTIKIVFTLVAVGCLFSSGLVLAGSPHGKHRHGHGRLLERLAGPAHLLRLEEVQGELGISDEQRDSLKSLAGEVRNEIRDEAREIFSGMRDLDKEARGKRKQEIRGRMEEIREDIGARVQKVLTAEQWKRLQQIDLQAKLQRRGAKTLASDKMAEALALNDDQRQQLRQRSEEVRKEMHEKIRALRQEARGKMLDVLTTEQRSKLEAMKGDKFDLPKKARKGHCRGDRCRSKEAQSDKPSNES